jgi:FtsH-binding integral membrane protein
MRERAQSRPEVVNAFMRGVYGWMFAGLATTALVAYGTFASGLWQIFAQNMILFFGVILAEIGLVIGLSARINRMSASTATSLFVLYSALNGLTFSLILIAYPSSAIFKAFACTAGMFGAMSIFGYVTKKDLTSWGSFLFMGLIGIIIASVVNIFLKSPMMHFVISGIGVLVFLGLTAYDTQQLKTMGETAPMDDATAMRRGSILGALRLYLDFINLFLFMLQFFGMSRD